jgi:hypothetical protein
MKQKKIFILTRFVAILLFSDDNTEHSVVTDAIVPRATKNGIKLVGLLILFIYLPDIIYSLCKDALSNWQYIMSVFFWKYFRTFMLIYFYVGKHKSHRV